MTETAPQLSVIMFSTEFKYYRVGGLGAHIAALAPRLASHITLDLVLPRYSAEAPALETIGLYGRVHRVDVNRPDAGMDLVTETWDMNDRLYEYVRRLQDEGRRFDVIHVHDWQTSFVGNHLYDKIHCPLVATIHATEEGRMRTSQLWGLSGRIREAERAMVARAECVITCSQSMKAEVVKGLHASTEKVVVIPNGVERQVLEQLRATGEGVPEARARWATPEQPLIFFVGRLVHEKGADVLIRAMPAILNRYPQAKAVIAGDGPERAKLRALVSELRLQQHVHLAGLIDDATRNRLYVAADVAVFPSRYEPFGIVALEALTAEAPLVASRVGGFKEIIEGAQVGWCTQPDDSRDLAQAILTVLEHPEQAAERVARGRELVASVYNWDRIAEATIRQYLAVKNR